MSHHKVCPLLLVAALCGVSARGGAEVAVPIPNAQRLEASPSAALPPARLEDLLAPIALYPDALLSQVLVASTYPLEIVEARQWLQRNRDLAGERLMEEAKKQSWDASVQSLVAFPQVLDTLTEDIGWTSSLGDAFLAQEADVMAAVQRLRGRARASGKLVSTEQQSVTAEEREGQTVVQIVPATTEVVYVPRYDPYYVWGAPAWSAYPSLYYSPGYAFAGGVDIGFWFGGWSWGLGWGWYPNWYGGSVWVNGAWFNHCGYHYAHYDSHHGGYHGGYGPGHGGGGHGGDGGHGGQGSRMAWSHDPGHRQGVPYASGRNSSRYEAASRASRTMAGGSGWRSGRETASIQGGRASTFGSRGGSDQGWRNPASGTRGLASASPMRRPERGSASESWRDPGSASRPSASRWNGSASPRSPESAGRDSSAAPRSLDGSRRSLAASPRSQASQGWPSSGGPSTQGYRTAPRAGSEGGRGWSSGGGSRALSSDGGGRGWSSSAAPRSSPGSFGSGGSRGTSGGYSGGVSPRGSSGRSYSGGGSPRGSSGGGYSGGGSRSGGGSSGGGHRGGGGRH